ncbi:hypothetical protein [Halorussus halobius]|uniref:hypothetical protein n=1 Tax=Halorussus halobius TaxID=1710537 RepID=UPI00143CF2F5|nr:hypothetical protein [Halorussus halobius]
MRRRRLLALSGSLLAGSAGCLSASAPEAPATRDATTTEATTTAESATTDASTTTAEPADVSVSLDALQPAMVTMTSPDSIGVRDDDRQYLLVDVSTSGDGEPPDPESFAVRFDGTDYGPESVDEPWRFWRFEDGGEAFYDPDSGEGLLLFELPASAGSDDAAPALTWPGGEWRPDGTVRRRLLAPEPSLSVTVDAPESVEPHESPTVSVTVENAGDVPGRFVAGLNRTGPMVAYTPIERVSVAVAAGESETWEHADALSAGDDPDERVGDGESDMTYHLDWAGGDVHRGVRYAEASDATT